MDGPVLGETNGKREDQEMRSSKLLVYGYGRKILQRAMRNDGNNAGHRMQMCPSGLQRQNRLESPVRSRGYATVGKTRLDFCEGAIR
jgi:hypothetical protein